MFVATSRMGDIRDKSAGQHNLSHRLSKQTLQQRGTSARKTFFYIGNYYLLHSEVTNMQCMLSYFHFPCFIDFQLVAFAINILSARLISASMLRRCKSSLNEISQKSAERLISCALKNNINVAEVRLFYLDFILHLQTMSIFQSVVNPLLLTYSFSVTETSVFY